jgi:hypothetical protein
MWLLTQVAATRLRAALCRTQSVGTVGSSETGARLIIRLERFEKPKPTFIVGMQETQSQLGQPFKVSL